ncbi:hypothetical protein WR25_26323 isoform B [Diploscapter pachys]|nr:hypothetical protein WR25_26323 isoform B [Diploscapter pachys]
MPPGNYSGYPPHQQMNMNGPPGGHQYGPNATNLKTPKQEPVRSWDNNQQPHYYGSQQGGWGGGPAGGIPPMGAGSGYPPQSMNPTSIGNGSHNGGSSQPPSVLEALITHPQYPMHPNSRHNMPMGPMNGAPGSGPGMAKSGPPMGGQPTSGSNIQVTPGLVEMTPQEQQTYQRKLHELRPHCDNLRLRSQQCRIDGNHEAAHKLEVMLAVLEGRRVVTLEYLSHLESWIYKKQEFLAGASQLMQNGGLHAGGQGAAAGNASNSMMNPAMGDMNNSVPQGMPSNIPPTPHMSAPNNPYGTQGQPPMSHGGYMHSQQMPPMWNQGSHQQRMMPQDMMGGAPMGGVPSSAAGSMHYQRDDHHGHRAAPYPSPQMRQQMRQHSGSSGQPIRDHRGSVSSMSSMSGGAPTPTQSMATAQPPSIPGVDEIYNIEDFLPTPIESGGLQSSMQSGMHGQMSNATRPILNEAARREFSAMSDRFDADLQNVEFMDAQSVIVKSKLRSHTVPVLRVIVPAMYPNVNASIDRGTLDLDAYLYDDLQNQVHDRLSRVEQPTITNLLNTWEQTVTQFYQSQGGNPLDTFDEIFRNYDSF